MKIEYVWVEVSETREETEQIAIHLTLNDCHSEIFVSEPITDVY